MNSVPSLWTDTLRDLLRRHSIRHFTVAGAPLLVDAEAAGSYRQWLESGQAGCMDYLERYDDLRLDVGMLLPGARSMICCAIPYWHPDSAKSHGIAAYALGDDYHEVVRRHLGEAAAEISALTGGECRVCVDTAPLRERYWAARTGLGIKGCNGHIIVPGYGSYFFLGEIITTALLEPTPPPAEPHDCGRCGRCLRACPTGALQTDGSVDARRCLSYLTIEHRGEFPEGTDLHGQLYGCDICTRICPHNRHPEQAVYDEFTPREEVLAVTAESALTMTQEQFSATFRHSAIKRTKLAGLRRNAATLLADKAAKQ